MSRKKITVMTACYNEEENVLELYEAVKKVMVEELPEYDYEHLFIDNCSEDKTVTILKGIAYDDKNVKIIVNSRNFGHIRSPFYGLLQGSGDAVISVAADFQDPPEMIPMYVKKWEEGNKIVIGIKSKSKENKLMFSIRCLYYKIIKKISDSEQVENFTGFGLYDRVVIDELRKMNDPYPYFRGMICEVGFKRAEIEFVQPKRERGITKNNFYTLYDMAMTGITANSKVPLRIATMLGFAMAGVCLIVALVYFVIKLLLWNTFNLGLAPMIIGQFFIGSVLLAFIGIIGEYVGMIYTKVENRPLVVEKERINFDGESSDNDREN